jgi:D-3-phosphoglycerate dehydrogenase
MMRILVTTQMMIHDQERFSKALSSCCDSIDFVMNEQFLTEEQCLELPPIYDGWIAGDDEITCSVIDHMLPRLKVISKWGTGIDSIESDYAESQGVSIKNSPGAFSDAVGEMAVAYLLSLTRGVVSTDRCVRRGIWPKNKYRTLVDFDVGFIGMGAIGSGAAARLASLGCDVHYSDPLVTMSDYKKVSIEDLFYLCDAVIITSSLNPSTNALVNKSLIARSKKGVIIINVGRGPIVVEEDLVWGLEEGIVVGVALDVYETEPLPVSSKLLKFENVILGSHNANNTVDAVEYVHKNTIDQLKNALSERASDE